jgi:asparagine N-glycosylation enzyme membrane subunit Stt3
VLLVCLLVIVLVLFVLMCYMQDARVLSWWDYGYQIAGIANRTTLADGNTWNLEHIALIGKILTSSQPEVSSRKKKKKK